MGVGRLYGLYVASERQASARPFPWDVQSDPKKDKVGASGKNLLSTCGWNRCI
jgi:hypothetical protein